LRVGIAAGITFALGRDVPIHGVPSHDAAAVGRSSCTVVTDVRRRELAWTTYRDGVAVNGPSLTTEGTLAADVDLREFPEVRATTISAALLATAALNRIEQKEKHKELTLGKTYDLNIQVVTDRAALARDAMAALADLPHAEEEDYRIIVHELSGRLRPVLEKAIEGTPDAALPEIDRAKYSRDAAHWVIRESGQELSEAIFEGIADQAMQVEARPLPDVMIFPQDIPLDASAKNIYGVFPPSTENAQEVESVLFMDERQWWADQSFELHDHKLAS
jgi:hypothetical protein